MLDGAFQVALLDGKAVIVGNKAGHVVIDRVGVGTQVKDADTAPAKPKKWGGNKLERALTTVAF